MDAPIIGVSENAVRKVRRREDLDAFFRDNGVGQVSVPLLCLNKEIAKLVAVGRLSTFPVWYTLGLSRAFEEEGLLTGSYPTRLNSNVSQNLLLSLYDKCPDLVRKFSTPPLNFDDLENSNGSAGFSASVQKILCACRRCTRDVGDCGAGVISFTIISISSVSMRSNRD
jgi:hypothetical protein